jgi:hypothetical protein
MVKVTPWEDPGLPEAVEYDSDELKRIRRRTIDGLLALPRVGMGVGGLLLGTRESGVIRILGSREVSCAHAFGPGFRLTEEEIADAEEISLRPATRQVVGWYCSKPRGKAELAEEDQKLFDALCPLSWQIALLIVPSTVDVSRAAVFTRDRGGALFPLPEAEAETPQYEAASVIEEIYPPSPGSETPPPASASMVSLSPLFAVPASPRRASSLPRWAVAALLGMFALWGVVASRDLWWPQPKLDLRSFDSGGALTIEWNSGAVKGIGGGTLEIREGGEAQIYALNAAQLRAGTVNYSRKTGRVSALLRAGRIEEAVTFTGPPPAAMKR